MNLILLWNLIIVIKTVSLRFWTNKHYYDYKLLVVVFYILYCFSLDNGSSLYLLSIPSYRYPWFFSQKNHLINFDSSVYLLFLHYLILLKMFQLNSIFSSILKLYHIHTVIQSVSRGQFHKPKMVFNSYEVSKNTFGI